MRLERVAAASLMGVLALCAPAAGAVAWDEESVPDLLQERDYWMDIITLHRKGQQAAAFRKALEYASRDDFRIWCFLGDCYQYGAGTAKDGAAALRCYQQVEHLSYAKYKIGWLYATGNGDP